MVVLVSVPFQNVDTKFSQNVENQVANSLKVFENQFGIIILKITDLCFAYTHQTTHLQLSPQLYASLSMWVKFPYLGRVAFWEYFEKQTCYLKKGMYEVYEKKSKCENTTYFPQIMVHTNFERTFKRIVFNRNILFLECSIKD